MSSTFRRREDASKAIDGDHRTLAATQHAQSVEQWLSVRIADGSRVTKIVGDQMTKAEFRYFMPNQSLNIHREVVFICENGDWRAEG